VYVGPLKFSTQSVYLGMKTKMSLYVSEVLILRFEVALRSLWVLVWVRSERLQFVGVRRRDRG
jgi:hypothetical protein